MAFHEHDARPLADTHERADEDSRRLGACGDEHQMQRTPKRRAGSDIDEGAIPHECRVEVEGYIVHGDTLPELSGRVCVSLRQGLGPRTDTQSGFEGMQIRQLRRKGSVDEYNPARLDSSEHLARI